MKTFLSLILATGLGGLCDEAEAQSVLFDFENAQAHTPLPLSLTVGGITASFSSTGLGGYYIDQPRNSILVTPAGFSGNALIPSSIYGADLNVKFSRTLTDFSILYAPQELACDSSATIRVTAFLDLVAVGTTTTNATAGTWPSETISISCAQGFNSVVVHYDAAPATGGDYGCIFVADNMMVTPAVSPQLQISRLNHQIQIAWPTNAMPFVLQSCTNLLSASGWSSVTNPPIITGSQNAVTLPVGAAATFYRLKR